MKVYLTPIKSLQKSVALFGKKAQDSRGGCLQMNLDFGATSSQMILKLSPRRLEGIAQGNIGIPLTPLKIELLEASLFTKVDPLTVQAGLLIDDDALSRYLKVNAYMKWIASIMMLMRNLNNHVAANDLIEELLQFGDLGANMLVQGL